MQQREAPQTTFDVPSVRLARRVAPDGSFKTSVVAVITQRQPVPLDEGNIANGFFWFRGGATLIIDPSEGHEKICYSIIKNSGSKDRRDRQLQLTRSSALGSLRALYFGGNSPLVGVVPEPFAIMHADRGESHDD